MIVEMLAADREFAMSIRIVTPAEDAGVGDIIRKEISKPVDSICGCPSLLSMSIQAMDGNDTDGDVRLGTSVMRGQLTR